MTWHKTKLHTFFTLLCVMFICACVYSNKPQLLQSPDKNTWVRVALTDSQTLTYEVFHKGKAVILPSQLGLEIKEGDFSQTLSLVNTSSITRVTDSYEMLVGKRKFIKYQANQQQFTVKNNKNQLMVVEFRVSNNGVAFRYRVDDSTLPTKQFIKETTEFTLAESSRAWLQPMAVAQTGWSNTNPSYEESYLMDIPVGTSSPTGAGWVFPALFHTDNTWVAISETNLTENWHGSRLHAQSQNGRYKLDIPMSAEVFTQGALLASSQGALISPWRIMALGSLAEVMESTLGTDLAAPAIKLNADFIKPGHASWSWAILKDESITFDIQKKFIDYAHDMKWDYTLVDVNWDTTIGFVKMQDLAAYATSKNVGLIAWVNSSGDWNITPYTPKSQLLTASARKAYFARLERMGIKGVKIDFFAGDGQSMIAYYHDILRDAADAHLLVNFHGSTLPRGWQRTYPNLMTMEAIKGFEFTTFTQETQDEVATHAVMSLFARNLFDPMDFTPLAFGDIPGIIRKTNNSFELAESVLFLSGIQHFADTPEGLYTAPNYVLDFLRELPTTWDDVKFIDGYPGKYAIIARKHGDNWYIAGINASDKPINLTLDVSFTGAKNITLIENGNGERDFSSRKESLSNSINITLKHRAGFVAKTSP